MKPYVSRCEIFGEEQSLVKTYPGVTEDDVAIEDVNKAFATCPVPETVRVTLFQGDRVVKQWGAGPTKYGLKEA